MQSSCRTNDVMNSAHNSDSSALNMQPGGSYAKHCNDGNAGRSINESMLAQPAPKNDHIIREDMYCMDLFPSTKYSILLSF